MVMYLILVCLKLSFRLTDVAEKYISVKDSAGYMRKSLGVLFIYFSS